MMRFLISAYSLCCAMGIDLGKTLVFCREILPFLRDLRRFRAQPPAADGAFPLTVLNLHLGERTEASGNANGHYFHQDLLVARRIFARNPKEHFDLGSRIDGFVAHVASFRRLTVIDIRPLPQAIPNITFRRADLMAPLAPALHHACDSLSCLHAIEHFGLGRYGDPICRDGHLLGLANLYALLQPGGKFYFSAPIGPQRTEFNAHRVFATDFLLQLFRDRYQIDSFSLVDDRGDLHEDIALTPEAARRNFGCQLGCGIFEMTKR